MAFKHVSNVFKGVPVVFETDSLGFRAKAVGIRLKIPGTPLNTFGNICKPSGDLWHGKHPKVFLALGLDGAMG